ncbi:alanyl-tRNA editing protein [Yoonia sediminilitoris]|uniref:Alanine--tRNA ligase n=1 Tax=Yoonia sediminilitoris TaxID=1286148 RepID=A0A2T6K990_9RHOB|nr:alanyl-tRNA editing protein [Yoonia sediminilitoris]PUB11317.1 Ala-tRNA(Pro) hydrolase [Yoonia sediminilitoris]RCW91133.1 Ala-tRNA(Pro) hydrolase [Yoonia sediminilitoris]
MTELLFRKDAYLREAQGRVKEITAEGGVVLDKCLFYPTSGGQPGDSGELLWEGGRMTIATAVKGAAEDVVLLAAEPANLPEVGQVVQQTIDWDRRHRHMRVHTALHLLSVVIPLPVTGGAISAEKGRLDFDMPEAPQDKAALEDDLNRLIACNMDVTEEWITDTELDAQPDLVKTMSVQPPRGTGMVRLVRIGVGKETADLQPCGGTHVANTDEIGRVRLGKIEKKGRENRRVYLHLD